jgi:A/G-specific adenine glycosylase
VQDGLPVKAPKAARRLRYGTHFLARDAAGRMLLRHRPPTGLLGGMLEIPGTPWTEAAPDDAAALEHAPIPGLAWRALPAPRATDSRTWTWRCG